MVSQPLSAIDRLKAGTMVQLAQATTVRWTKYIHGSLGEGTWTYYGGHDPEDAGAPDR